MSASLAMQHLSPAIDALVALRSSQRAAQDWDGADQTRRAIASIRVMSGHSTFIVALQDAKGGDTWFWTTGAA